MPTSGSHASPVLRAIDIFVRDDDVLFTANLNGPHSARLG
jgi:hypothetical protein